METNVQTKPVVRRKRRLRRVVISLVVILALVFGGLGAYNWWLGTKAKEVYELGTTLNTFFGDYSAALAQRNVDSVMAKYHGSYASERGGLWHDKLVWEDSRPPRPIDRTRIYTWEESNPGSFTVEDVRKQIEGQLARIDQITFAKTKIETIEGEVDLKSARVKILRWLRGRQANGETVETKVHLRLWLVNDNGWKIQREELLHGSTVRGGGAGFQDVTESAGIDFKAVHNPMHQEAEWKPKRFEIAKYAEGGVSVADYDNDGWYDIFFCDGESPRLYRNCGDGKFKDTTSAAGLPDVLKGVSVAIFADLTNSGNVDLFLGRSTAENQLFRNNGNGTFTDVTASAKVGGYFVAVASAADFDNDGLIDLYIGRYLDPRTNLPTTLFYTRNGEGNTLLRNEGTYRFTDVTAKAGMREGGLTLGLCWGDYDGDRNIDVYVANDFGRGALMKNNGDGTFSDVTRKAGVSDLGYGMSSNFADFRNNGRLDLYVSRVHSGQRWFGNEATLKNYIATSFKQGTISEDKVLYNEILELVGDDWDKLGEQVIRGNSFYLNNGDGSFNDITEESGANPPGWFWGAAVLDYDNSGSQDIFVANGWITGEKSDDL